MMTGGGGSISSTGDSGENRPKSVCGSVCTFDFHRQETPHQCLRAVGLRPDSDGFRMQPYALPLKGKRPKRLQLPKEVRKVHTASLMFAHPYSLLTSCSSQKSAYSCIRSAYRRINAMEVRGCSLESKGRAFSDLLFSVRIHALQACLGPNLIANCLALLDQG